MMIWGPDNGEILGLHGTYTLPFIVVIGLVHRGG